MKTESEYFQRPKDEDERALRIMQIGLPFWRSQPSNLKACVTLFCDEWQHDWFGLSTSPCDWDYNFERMSRILP